MGFGSYPWILPRTGQSVEVELDMLVDLALDVVGDGIAWWKARHVLVIPDTCVNQFVANK